MHEIEKQSAVTELLLLPPPTAPLDVAKVFVVQHYVQNEALTLRYWRGSWWEWAGPHWTERDRDWIGARLYEFADGAIYHKSKPNGELEKMPWLPNKRRVADLLDALKVVCETKAKIDPPCWLDERAGGRVVPCSNGLLDVETRTLTPHTPMFFNLMSLPYGYDEEAKCPTWDSFMTDLFGDDEEPMCALEEFLGCAVAGKIDLHRILLLVGPTRGGKSVIASLFEALLGSANVTWPRLSGLTDDKTLSSLIGKSACIIADMRATARKGPEIAEALLSLSGGDKFTIDRKYKEAWIGLLPVLLMIISNEMPSIRDAASALPKRYLLVKLTKSFLGKEDRTLKDRLLAELPGILNRALDGLDRVAETGCFTEPAASRDAAAEMVEMASPMIAYLEEEAEVGADFSAPAEPFRRAYNEWATRNGEAQISRENFGRRLRACLPMVGRSQYKDREGRRVVHYTGVRMRQATSSGRAAAALEELKMRIGGPVRVVDGREG